MSRTRRPFSDEFKAKIALEAIRGYRSMSELVKEYQVHLNAIVYWKKEALEIFPEIYNHKQGPKSGANAG